MMYQLVSDPFNVGLTTIMRFADQAAIPLDALNVDYQQFRRDMAAGMQLEDQTGSVMTTAQVASVLAGFP